MLSRKCTRPVPSPGDDDRDMRHHLWDTARCGAADTRESDDDRR
jgi:hypothetical protein